MRRLAVLVLTVFAGCTQQQTPDYPIQPVPFTVHKWKTQPFIAIPYYAWAHRGISEMAVWFPYRADAFEK